MRGSLMLEEPAGIGGAGRGVLAASRRSTDDFFLVIVSGWTLGSGCFEFEIGAGTRAGADLADVGGD